MPALGHTSSSTAEIERKAFARAPHRSPRSYSDEVRDQESHVVAWFGQGDRADSEIMSVLPDSERLSSCCPSTLMAVGPWQRVHLDCLKEPCSLSLWMPIPSGERSRFSLRPLWRKLSTCYVNGLQSMASRNIS